MGQKTALQLCRWMQGESPMSSAVSTPEGNETRKGHSGDGDTLGQVLKCEPRRKPKSGIAFSIPLMGWGPKFSPMKVAGMDEVTQEAVQFDDKKHGI